MVTREFFFKVHLYLALSVGVFWVLIGLSGSLCVYHEQIDEWLNPRLVVNHPLEKYQSLDKIFAAVQSAHPDRNSSWTIEMPRTRSGMVTAWYQRPRETFFEWYAPLMVTVDPYTAEVVANRFWGQTLMTWLVDLHTQLAMGQFGVQLVGILGLLLTISVVAGCYWWWSGLKGLATLLLLRHRLGVVQFAMDLHRLLGWVSAIILLLLSITGTLLSFPAMLELIAGSSTMSHGAADRTILSTAVPNNRPVNLAAAEFVARSVFPRAELSRIITPVGNNGVYQINFRQKDEVNQRHPYSTVWVDRWSGQIREVSDPFDFTVGEKIVEWLWPIHTGEAIGRVGRLIWFSAGLVLLLLFLSGLVKWLHRLGRFNDRALDLSKIFQFFKKVLAVLVLAVVGVAKHLKIHLPRLVSEMLILWRRFYAEWHSANREK